jgi:hypothetical protein
MEVCAWRRRKFSGARSKGRTGSKCGKLSEVRDQNSSVDFGEGGSEEGKNQRGREAGAGGRGKNLLICDE